MFGTGRLVKKGRPVFFFMSGGGGWGDPLDRPPEWVLEDVANELLSVEAAASEFGVVVKPGRKPWRYDLDLAATADLRRRLRSGQAAVPAGPKTL
jgi:N-methylhydantoinase B